MKIEDNEIIFSTGKRVFAIRGIIRLSPEGQITSGYDGNFSAEKLSPQESLKLANYMIAKWQKFKLSLNEYMPQGFIDFEGVDEYLEISNPIVPETLHSILSRDDE